MRSAPLGVEVREVGDLGDPVAVVLTSVAAIGAQLHEQRRRGLRAGIHQALPGRGQALALVDPTYGNSPPLGQKRANAASDPLSATAWHCCRTGILICVCAMQLQAASAGGPVASQSGGTARKDLPKEQLHHNEEAQGRRCRRSSCITVWRQKGGFAAASQQAQRQIRGAETRLAVARERGGGLLPGEAAQVRERLVILLAVLQQDVQVQLRLARRLRDRQRVLEVARAAAHLQRRMQKRPSLVCTDPLSKSSLHAKACRDGSCVTNHKADSRGRGDASGIM